MNHNRRAIPRWQLLGDFGQGWFLLASESTVGAITARRREYREYQGNLRIVRRRDNR